MPVKTGDSVTIGIRPEKLRLDEPSSLSFAASVRLTEYLGRETVVYAEAGDLVTVGSDSGTAAFTIQMGAIKPFAIGQQITVGFDPEDAYLFTTDGITATAPKPSAKP